MGLFGQTVAGAQASEGGVWWLPGKYLVQIDACKLITSRKKELLFIVEADNLESNNPQRPVGQRCSWIVKVGSDAGPGNIKQFIAAVCNEKVDEITEEVADLVVDEKQNPLNGRLVYLDAVIIQTKAGADFTKHRWQTAPDSVQEKAAALRDAAGLPPF